MSEFQRAEREAVERVLAFANLRKVTEPERVYELLEGPKLRYRLALLTDDGSVIPLSTFQRLREQGEEAARIFNGDLRRVAKMLGDFADTPRKARELHGQRIGELAAKGAMFGVPTFDRGRVRVDLRYVASGVESSCGYGLALIYDASKPYGAALARCSLESCANWLLRFASTSGGRRPEYCCTEHQRTADKVRAVERARAWRAARKEGSQ